MTKLLKEIGRGDVDVKIKSPVRRVEMCSFRKTGVKKTSKSVASVDVAIAVEGPHLPITVIVGVVDAGNLQLLVCRSRRIASERRESWILVIGNRNCGH